MIKMHYGMWVTMAIFFIVFGMLFRGYQDMAEQQKFNEGAAMILKDVSVKQLTDLNI